MFSLRSWVSSLWPFSSSCEHHFLVEPLSPRRHEMTVQNKVLSEILDENGDAPAAPEAPAGLPEAALHEEHMKRVTAEGEAAAAAQRLAVAQQQFTEFLGERAATEEALASQAAALEAALASGDPGALAAEVARLREGLAAAALEVRSAAAQMAEEAARGAAPKRSSSAASLGGDVEMKKARSGDGEGGEPMSAEDGGEEVAGGGGAEAQATGTSGASFRERAKYIPLRLDPEERRMLRLLEGALAVSEYTDKVDVLSYRSKAGRVHAQIKDLCAILCGLTVAQNFKRGQALLADRDFDTLDTFFQDAFEVGRRYKVMNPERMRDSYGKLMYMLMDAADPAIVELLGFRCVRPLRTVAAELEAAGPGALAMLDDPLMGAATAEIHSEGRPRAAVQKDIRTKERARETLARRYRAPGLDEEALLRCLYSVADNNSFLAFARDPVDRMIDYLTTWFRPDGADAPEASLAIQGGSEGARLTHSHARQYAYVLQSLTLWREIAEDAFKLWYLAEGDMLAERNAYRLQNTGQGLQRVQAAPRVGRAMAEILGRCQRRIGSWVGSSVVHLGDHNVPTALHFLDKYSQVPLILNPVVGVLGEIPRLARDPQIAAYLQAAFGGAEAVRRLIMVDFFRHAFDGSGADNFFDAGSCIDGRLTSAWNWCSKIEKKAYYPVFKLAGFAGFNGDFKA